MTGDAHVWSHCRQTCGPLILYIWDHTTTRPRGGVVVWTVRPYLDIWHIHSCIWVYVDMVTTVPIHIVTNGFMVADDGPLLLVQEELCIKVISTKDYLWYIVLPSNMLTSGTSTIPSPNTGWGTAAVTLPNIPRYGWELEDASLPSRRVAHYGVTPLITADRPTFTGLLVYDGMLMTSVDSLINYRHW